MDSSEIRWPVLETATPENVEQLIADLLSLPNGSIWHTRISDAILYTAQLEEQKEIRRELRETHKAYLGNKHVDYALGDYADTFGARDHRKQLKSESPEIYAALEEGFKRFDDVARNPPSAERKAKEWNEYREDCRQRNQEHNEALKLIPTFTAGDRIRICERGVYTYGIYIGPTTNPFEVPVRFMATPVETNSENEPDWTKKAKTRRTTYGSYLHITKVDSPSPSEKRVKVVSQV
jgi:hypothetical protein